MLCRFTVQETVQLLADLGFRDGSAFENNGITGGDLLELDNSELREDLGLTNLQVFNFILCSGHHIVRACGTAPMACCLVLHML